MYPLWSAPTRFFQAETNHPQSSVAALIGAFIVSRALAK